MKKFLSATLAAVILLVSVFSVNIFALNTTKTEALINKIKETREVAITLTAGDVEAFGEFLSATDTIYIKGDSIAYEHSMELLTARVVLNDGDFYGFIPAVPYFYVKAAAPGISSMDIWAVINDITNISFGIMKHVRSFEEEYEGETYYVEEFNDRAQVTSKFYYDGDDLKILKVIDKKTNSMQITYFENISFTVDDSIFQLPTFALDLTPMFKAFLAAIATI